MKQYQLVYVLNVPRLTPGRRSAALTRMMSKLGELTPAQASILRPLILESIAVQREAIVMRQARRTSNSTAMHAAQAGELDKKLDKLLSALHASLSSVIELFEGRKAELARKVNQAVFPEGVSPITALPFVEQHELLVIISHTLRSGEIGAAMTELELSAWISRLEELNAAYGEQLTRSQKVSPQDARESDTRGWSSLASVVARVVGLFPSDSEGDRLARELLLEAIEEQKQQAALLRARRRGAGLAVGDPEGEEDLEDEIGESEGEAAQPAA